MISELTGPSYIIDDYTLGIDIGSISINSIVLDRGGKVRLERYDYCQGRPFEQLKHIMEDLLKGIPEEEQIRIAFTGSGGKLASEILGGIYINEVIAQSEAVSRLYPQVRTVIEMGGEDSKLILMNGPESDATKLSDFEMNTVCAAGTGSFLDQQAHRIGVSIEKEFGEMALRSKNPPRIAGRCSVFAKSDMIHLQQIATPVHDIVAGLCFAVARNFVSTLGRGKQLNFPVSFQGGVAANAGMVRAFRELLNAGKRDLIVPKHHASMGAIGAALYVMKQGGAGKFRGLEKLEQYLEEKKSRGNYQEPLTEADTLYDKTVHPLPDGLGRTDVFLGLDVGSLSTNVVLIDEQDRVVARRYLPTESRPLEAIRQGMAEILAEVGERVNVKAAGTTGSGRYLTGDFIGADVIRNEITAQATAAIAYDPEVDTIFEIGGQDSKYISIDNGVVVDFEMNKVCAAGTGSFLQEQAEKLNINIVDEFAELALKADKPAAMGDRCTVFMETDLNSFQQKGVEKENLVGGLAYSIVKNYILKVVRKKRIGNHVLFQGGVTNNKAVVAAFEKITGKKIYVPPHFDVTGAIGAAMLARDYIHEKGTETRFKGFDIAKTPYKVKRFTCKGCSNECEIRRVQIEGESKALYYGGRCEKYELEERKGKGKGIPDYFQERVNLLMEGYDAAGVGKQGNEITADKEKPTVGIPRALMVFYQLFPFWRTFFEHLGFRVVISRESDNTLIKKSLEMIVAETCFPVELVHGHIDDLFQQQVDYIFAPFIINTQAEADNQTSNYNCPWIQTYPFMVKPALEDEQKEKLLVPTLNFRYFGKVLNRELADFVWDQFKIPKARVVKGIQLAQEAQLAYENKIKSLGEKVFASLPEDKECLVILGRPYNTGDPSLNLSMIEKLINLDVLPIPLDFLPLQKEGITKDYNKMYWPNGQKILAAARLVAKDPRLHAIYMGNFRCGPDSFLSHFVHEEMAGKPYMELEIDEHSADAGMITRYEAFLDSLRGARMADRLKAEVLRPRINDHSPSKDRVLYFPYMCDAAHAISAAARSVGVASEVLPMQDKEDLDLGRKYTSARECFPLICTTGSFLKKLKEPGVDPSKISFFMPDHNGPCRFGQYNRLQRVIFDKLGYEDVKIISPSNDASYEDIGGESGSKFRFRAWKGFVAVDILRKLKQERKPYEAIAGSVEKVYQESLQAVVRSIENGAGDLAQTLHEAGKRFLSVPLVNGERKPVIAVVGEIFMRDNPFCSGFLVQRLEKFGAETFIAPFSEWIAYSTIRWTRDSRWKGDYKGMVKSRIQSYAQEVTARQLFRAVHGMIDEHRDISVNEMLNSCGAYIHRHYDGDPALNIGSSVILAQTGISGIVNILPFTCMPGTVVSAVSRQFKKDHNELPYLSIPYDGQEDTAIELRLQAFLHQAREYARKHGLDKVTAVD
jgi:predicted CoA-substrate-specific enzyme activase